MVTGTQTWLPLPHPIDAAVDVTAGQCSRSAFDERTDLVHYGAEGSMSEENVAAVRRLFAAVERRDLTGVLAAYAPDVVIREAESLPYGGTYQGRDGAERHAYAYEAAWAPLQEPGVRTLDYEVLDAGEHVIVRWRQRGCSPDGHRAIDLPAVSVYRMQDGLVAESIMFQHDTAAVVRFLAETR